MRTNAGCEDRRRGALLLEVLIALAVLTLCLGLLGAQLAASVQMTSAADQQTRATQLQERLLALLELDPNLTQRFFAQRELDGDFGEEQPGWLWRARIEKTDIDGLGLLTMDVLRLPHGQKRGNVTEAHVVRSVHLLKADPAKFNVISDGGLDPNLLMAGMPPRETGADGGDGSGGPGSATGGPGGGALSGAALAALVGTLPPEVLDENGNFDPAALARLPLTQLIQILPSMLGLLQSLGIPLEGLGLPQGGLPSEAQLGELLRGGAGGNVPGPPGATGQPGARPSPMGAPGGGARAGAGVGAPGGGPRGIADLNRDRRGGDTPRTPGATPPGVPRGRGGR
jgi:hypothetical protein